MTRKISEVVERKTLFQSARRHQNETVRESFSVFTAVAYETGICGESDRHLLCRGTVAFCATDFIK
jgi:hypothetical protein